MKEFMIKHPILTLIMVFTVCGTVTTCVRIIKDPDAAKVKPVQFIFNTEKGDKKGA